MIKPLQSRAVKTRQIGNESATVLNLVQGEFQVSDDPQLVMTTLLGSCVAACLHDPVAGVGGMNHYLLPGEMQGNGEAERIGVHAMELLINALLSRGAVRRRLEAKLFGGACIMQGLTDVGALNAKFAQDFLRRENISIVSECLGGRSGRRVQFWPVSGRARRSFMSVVPPVAAAPVAPPAKSSSAGSLELF